MREDRSTHIQANEERQRQTARKPARNITTNIDVDAILCYNQAILRNPTPIHPNRLYKPRPTRGKYHLSTHATAAALANPAMQRRPKPSYPPPPATTETRLIGLLYTYISSSLFRRRLRREQGSRNAGCDKFRAQLRTRRS